MKTKVHSTTKINIYGDLCGALIAWRGRISSRRPCVHESVTMQEAMHHSRESVAHHVTRWAFDPTAEILSNANELRVECS